MRKVILYFHMSLDNVVSDTENWFVMNDEMLQSAIDFYETIDTAIFGSKTFPDIANYWMNAEKEPVSAIEQEYAKRINRIKKFVVSRSSEIDINWDNSELLKFTDLKAFTKALNEMKQQDGNNISVESGLAIWHLFLQNALFDELNVTVHPVIVGKGDKIFTVQSERYKLELKDSKTFDNGVTELRYVKK